LSSGPGVNGKTAKKNEADRVDDLMLDRNQRLRELRKRKGGRVHISKRKVLLLEGLESLVDFQYFILGEGAYPAVCIR
jgi:hypothetical protein